MIVDDTFSRLTTRMIVHDSISVSCFGNHWPDSGQKICCRPLSSQKFILLQVCLTRKTIVNKDHDLLWPFDHVNDSW